MIDIEELKKLPNRAKVELIDELLHSMDDSKDETDDNVELGDEVLQEMEQRVEAMRTGQMETYTWEEAKIILRDASNKRNTANEPL